MRRKSTELYILRSEFSRRKLSPTLASAHYSCPDYAIGLVGRGNWRQLGGNFLITRGKGSPHSITERRVPELIPVLGRQPAGDVSHKPGGRLPLLSARPAVTPATHKRAATDVAAW